MALHDIITKGAIDRSVTLRIIDSTDGTPETGVVFNTSGIDLWYRREGAAVTSITEATLAALTTAHTDGGFLHISHGEYRLDLPDAAFATGANYVDFGGTVTGMIVIGGRVRLTNLDLEAAALDDTDIGPLVRTELGTELAQISAMVMRQGVAQSGASGSITLDASASSDNAAYVGGLVVLLANTGARQVRQITAYNGTTKVATVTPNWGTTPDSTTTFVILPAASLAALATAAALATVDGIVDDILLDTAEIGAAGAGLTNINLPNQTMDIVGNITGNLSGSVGSVTGAVGSVTAGVTLAASAVQAIWDALTSALTTVGSIGKLLVDNINATISSRLATAGYTAPPTAAANADAVWDETLADHLGAGSTGNALNAAGSAGDPWSTAIPGAYGAGTAGKIVGDNVNATISSRSSHSAADVWAVATRTLTAFDASFKTGYALSAAGVQAIWDALTSALTTVGSIGKLFVDNVNATISSRSSHSAADVWAAGTRTLTAGTNIVLAKGTGVTGFNDLDAAGVRSAVGLAAANLDTQLDTLPTAAENAAALLDFANGIETSITPRQAMRLMLAASAGKLSGAATTTIVIRNVGDTKDRITATVTADGNRTAVTTDAT